MSPRQAEEGGAGGAGREEDMMERRDQRLGNCVEQSVGIACCARKRGHEQRPVGWSGERSGGGGEAEARRTRGTGGTGKAGADGGGRSAQAGDGVRPFSFFYPFDLID